MKKLHYANVKLIIASDKTNVGEEIIEEGRTRFGKKLIVDKKVFDAESREVNSEKQFDLIDASDIEGDTYYLIDNGEEVLNVHKIKNDLSNKGLETKALKPAITWDELKKNSDGLVPVIVTDYRDGSVLMMAYMNEEAYNNTFVTGLMNYYSRSRQTQWIKGETSGHYQYVKFIKADCDKDTLLAGVSQIGVACHTGSPTCFFNDVIKADYTEKNPAKIFDNLYKVIEDRKENPKEGSYTNYLFDKGLDKILKKV
ncbi:MAG: phosphoribosyl-AMP cyclohydrolase, partial [Lachnospiraceae bacterium]|nr:phosphoribosyl-AMP cyclohydrolase [Lachnospiraceae bacterium]